MSRYNRFGKVYNDVIACYPGTVLADYDAGGANGQTKIEDALDRSTLETAASLTPDVFTALTRVSAEEVSGYATAGQTAFALGSAPIVDGTVHLWIYPILPPAGYGWTGASVSGYYGDVDAYAAPTIGYNEVAASDYSVTALSGALTYSGPTLSAGARLYASYSVDVDNSTFASPMLGQIAVLGAAAELGERLYSASTQEWALVTQYRTRYNALLEQLKDGSLIPDEIRRLKYFKEIERSSNEVRSVRFTRG